MRSLARQHFDEFMTYMRPDYHMGWFHRRLAAALDRFADDVIAKKSPRLILEAPPRHGKVGGRLASAPGFSAGTESRPRNPRRPVMATRWPTSSAADVQKIIDSEKYHALFPDTRIPGMFGKRNAVKRSRRPLRNHSP